MKKLKFRYTLRIEFDSPVTHHSFTVRCSPESDERQTVLQLDIHIIPKEFLCGNRDSFGNAYFFGRTETSHELFEVVTEGVVLTGLSEKTKAEEAYRIGMFLGQTAYTKPDEDLKEFFRQIEFPDGEKLVADEKFTGGEKSAGGEKHVNSEKPADGEKPVDGEKLVADEKFTGGEKSAGGEKLVDREKPAGGEKLVDREKPAGGEKLVDRKRPADGEKPVDRENTLGAGRTNLQKSLLIMEAIRAEFVYTSGATDIYTTAAQAWSMKQGVCQDYSHIMLCLCRMAGIPCRYVAGMLIGEGFSHAWVEIEDGGSWYGLDPTNGTRVFEDHIKISHGRDYGDCLMNQGVFTGNARQKQTVSVSVYRDESQP